jgi:hypothetical protein
MVAKLAALSRRCRSARGGSSVSSIIRSTYVPSAVPSAGFEHALTALEGNPVRDNYLVKHVVPVWLGTFEGAFPANPPADGTRGHAGCPGGACRSLMCRKLAAGTWTWTSSTEVPRSDVQRQDKRPVMPLVARGDELAPSLRTPPGDRQPW